MENTKINIESLERQDRIEKIVVITLLIIAICAAVYAFTSRSSANLNASSNAQNISDSQEIINAEPDNLQGHEVVAGDVSVDDINETIDEALDDLNDVADKTGLLVVGLFANPGNADRMKSKLDELGFEGQMKTREDGKTMVGVRSSENDKETFLLIMNHFSDAVFIAD